MSTMKLWALGTLLLAVTTASATILEEADAIQRGLNPKERSLKSSGSRKHGEEYQGNDLAMSMMSMMNVEMMSMNSAMNMRYHPDNGKGKGSKKSSKKSGKGSSGKGEKKGKKGSKKGGATVPPPTDVPTPSPSSGPGSGSADPPARPPVSITAVGQPTKTPTSAPVLSNLQEVQLSEYTILYTLANSIMPTRDHYMEVEEATNSFLNNYMQIIFEESSIINLAEFQTYFVTSEFVFDAPVEIVFQSSAYFTEESDLVPAATLETLLLRSLDDPTNYIDALVALGTQNAFSAVESVEFKSDDTTTQQPSESDSTRSSTAFVAAAAAGLTLLVAGGILYRRRSSKDQGYYSEDLNDKPMSGGATVAGDTFAGDTFDGTVSVSPSSLLSRDEERGSASHGLENVELKDEESFGPVLEDISMTSRDDYEDYDAEE